MGVNYNDPVFDICLLISNQGELLGSNMELHGEESNHAYWNELIQLQDEIFLAIINSIGINKELAVKSMDEKFKTANESNENFKK